MRLAFRCDSSLQIGSGHLARCLTLAEEARDKGGEVLFVCRELPGHMSHLVLSKGFNLEMLSQPSSPMLPNHSTGIPHGYWLGVSWEADAVETRQVLSKWGMVDWLVVDHYALNEEWEQELRTYAGHIAVIDDLADRKHNCDLLLDQNLQEGNRYLGLVPKGCRTLIGPHFALLRPQFSEKRKQLSPRSGNVSRLLLFFGGADVGGETLKALSAIEMLGIKTLSVDVVLGSSNPHRETIESIYQGRPDIRIHTQVEDMATLMGETDLFVGAGGTTSWERCCLGLPAIVMATADNQIAQCEALARFGAQLYLGPSDSMSAEGLSLLIKGVLSLQELNNHMSEQGQFLVDGRGVKRVTSYLFSTKIKFRRAGQSDCTKIFEWRNHPDTRRYALNPAEIDWAVHEQWFLAALADPNRELLIAEQDSIPVGVLRYDIEAERCVVSIYLIPGFAGRGFGLRILLAGEHWLQTEHPHVRRYEAEVATENQPSMAIFQAAGFLPYRYSLRKEIFNDR